MNDDCRATSLPRQRLRSVRTTQHKSHISAQCIGWADKSWKATVLRIVRQFDREQQVGSSVGRGFYSFIRANIRSHVSPECEPWARLGADLSQNRKGLKTIALHAEKRHLLH
jgi:hypothetical protein